MHPFRPISLKDAAGLVIRNCIGFLQIACGSASELEYHFLLARDLGYLPDQEYKQAEKQLLELKRMLVALTRKVASERPGNQPNNP